MFFGGSLGLDYLSPNAPLGLILLITGVIFTSIIFYVLYLSIVNKESLDSAESKKNRKKKQQQRIAKLYPNNSN
tara:strand:- start:231 stop:452 length:222 start_codon:yes stop_codon:yes gene_type:complete